MRIAPFHEELCPANQTMTTTAIQATYSHSPVQRGAFTPVIM